MEYKAARDSGVVILAKHSGTIEFVDADTIVIRRDGSNGKDSYHPVSYTHLDVYKRQMLD